MTIRVEREALLRVISRAPPSTITNSFKGPLIERRQQQREEEEFVIVEFPDAKEHAFFFDGLIPDSKDDDDQASFCTLSTDSVTTSSTSTLDDSHERRVTFAPELVTDVWTREKTPPEDIPRLFYSSNETQTFRQEYRFERKVLNDLSIDPESFPGDEEELSDLLTKASTTASSPNALLPGSPNSSSSRHRISRVVVLHNDKLETFFQAAATTANQEDFLSSLICAPSKEEEQTSPTSSSTDFFDNDSFWSGSLTWY